jgi:hypothetical protein
VVEYPAGASSTAHRHAKSAFIYAYVLSGEIRSKVDDEPVRIYRHGESWFESPGARHVVSENVSATAPARLLAVYVVDVTHEQLVTRRLSERTEGAHVMSQRMNYNAASPVGMKALGAVYTYVRQSGLSTRLVDLVYLRVSQINGVRLLHRHAFARPSQGWAAC